MKTKRLLATLLCLFMAVVLLPTTAFAAGEAAIQLGASGIGTNDKVYFGHYDSLPIDWRVTSAGADSLSFMSEYVLFDAIYNSEDNATTHPDITYQNSELYTVTLPNFKNNTDNFSDLEAAQMSGLGLPAAGGAATYRNGNGANIGLGGIFLYTSWTGEIGGSVIVSIPTALSSTISCLLISAFAPLLA